jgi:hypothetical protein
MSPVLLNCARTLSLAGLLAISALLSACGGGGGAQASGTTINGNGTTTNGTMTGTTPSVTSTTITSTLPTGSSTTGTTTVTSLDPAPDSSFYDTAVNNTCANAQENKFPENTTNSTLAEFEFSGRALDGTVGDGTLTVVKTNKPKEPFNKSGLYYKRNIETRELIDGLTIEPGASQQSRLTTKNEDSYYELANNRFGLVGVNEFLTFGDPDPITTTFYVPTFYDRIFALAPGQSMLQSETSTVSSVDNGTQSVVITKRISYVNMETVDVRGKPYVTCKYEVRKVAPQDNLVTTEWYLKGAGTLFKSKTVNAAGAGVRDVWLVRFNLNGSTVFPN